MNKLFITVLMCAFANVAGAEKILFVGSGHSNKAKVKVIQSVNHGDVLTIDHVADRSLNELTDAEALFAQYDLIVFDGVSKQETKDSFAKYAPLVQTIRAAFITVQGGEDAELAVLNKGLSAGQRQTLFDYYDNGGLVNLEAMLGFLKTQVFGYEGAVPQAPVIYPQTGLYHPDYPGLVFSSLEEFRNWYPNNESVATVALIVPRHAIEGAQTTLIDATTRALEAKGASVMSVFHEQHARPDEYLNLLQQNGVTVVDAFINLRTMHFANKRKAEFEQLGKPVFQTMTYFDGDQAAWEADPQGISANMSAFVLVLPETAGVIDPLVIAARNVETDEIEVVDYQLDYMVSRVLKMTALSKMANKDKRLTVFVWGDKDMGASFLNVPDSLHTISHRLENEGYTVSGYEHEYYSGLADRILNPFYRDYELQDLLDDDLAGLLPVSEYRAWLASLPEDVTAPVTDFWGEPEDNFMAVERDGKFYFVIPRIRNGNMLIMRQPPRGDSKDQDQMLYHATAVPMNHYYLAAYFYAREYWGSDAFIHLGTHGSQEYLPGKERGLSRYDGGSLVLGDVPVLYPFIVDDVGEAMQTKRRGGAVVISHMTPPYAAAGLQGVTADLHELMHQYNTLDDGGVKTKTGAQIVDLCVSGNFCEDFGWAEADIQNDFEGFLSALHDYMGELAAENQPLGLHSFGELPEKRLIISTITQMLGSDFIAQAAVFEAGYYANEAHSHSDADRHSSGHLGHEGRDDYHEAGETLSALSGYKTVRDFVVGEKSAESLDTALQAYVETGREYYAGLRGIGELDSLLAGLNGEYIPVKTGGDPVRHPDSLPTGFNLYGFDPTRLPTKAAYAQGSELIEQAIADYYAENGEYPDKMAFSLWSIEAMRHYGVLESQALKAMGVRPVWSADGRVVDTEIIPASELKRPRVDVVLSATGLYRDAFPNVMQRLARAVKSVATLKEENNSLWDNSQRVEQELLAQGMDEAEAEYLSTVRIFSNASGDYGSGVAGPVMNSDTWESDAKIAENYLSTMGYYFGADASRWGQMSEGLYATQLSGTDVVAFSRSSNLYGMITSDDPYEYFGSMALAVRSIDGASPDMLISNLRDAVNGKMEKASSFMAKELRTRNFNERWVKEMQKEGYAGAVTMAAAVSNFWGWQVVDPDIVRDDQWQEFYEVYVDDKLELGINEFFEQVNPGAQAQLLERMLEANRKDYWQADDETLKAILERYQTLVTQYDLMVDSETLREYVNAQSAGFGLQAQLPAPLEAVSPAPVEQVEGQQLKKVEQTAADQDQDYTLWLILLGCLLFVAAGAARQAMPRKFAV